MITAVQGERILELLQAAIGRGEAVLRLVGVATGSRRDSVGPGMAPPPRNRTGKNRHDSGPRALAYDVRLAVKPSEALS